ncbi:MAG: ATP synthase F1 subunit delta [Actinobacteria bacterium HGW-Actinobacteria-7]|jgi:F-type H+-transporting ATPase subunit delta|nr:MAG: ATP synthase F1 subunit delta [Actinobacteria bacterium HGW-Actinobacteria-7]
MRISRALSKQIVATYAEALFEAASSDAAVDIVGGQLEDALRTIRGHAELRDAVVGELAPAAVRASVVREVFASMHPALVATLAVMAERGEMELLSSIVEGYGRVAEARRDTVAVEVTTVVELTDVLRDAIKAKLSADFGKAVVLREKIDASIIGGVVISASGRRLDASIASQLEAARVTLSTAHTGGDV